MLQNKSHFKSYANRNCLCPTSGWDSQKSLSRARNTFFSDTLPRCGGNLASSASTASGSKEMWISGFIQLVRSSSTRCFLRTIALGKINFNWARWLWVNLLNKSNHTISWLNPKTNIKHAKWYEKRWNRKNRWNKISLFNKVGFTKQKRKESIASNYIESTV